MSHSSRSLDKKTYLPDDATKNIEEIEKVEHIDYKHQTDLSNIESTTASKAAWLIALVVSIGGLLFGYDSVYISAFSVTINDSLGHVLSSSDQEMVTSLTTGGALVGAVGACLTADRFGRRWPVWGACLTFVVGTVLQTCAFAVPHSASRRFVVGLGGKQCIDNCSSIIVPLYIGELASAQYRGRMVAFNHMSVTFGQFLASALGADFAQVKGEGWRATVGLGSPSLCTCGPSYLLPRVAAASFPW